MSVSPDMNPMQRARSGTVSLQRKHRVITCKPHGPFSRLYFTHLLLSNFGCLDLTVILFLDLLYANTITAALSESLSISHLLICGNLSFHLLSTHYSVYLSLLQFPVSTSVCPLV